MQNSFVRIAGNLMDLTNAVINFFYALDKYLLN